MKILLIGEYSRLHNSLKEGLQNLGHEVTLISYGDGMKQYPSDILLKSKITKNKFLRKINNLSIRVFKKDFIKVEFKNHLKKVRNQLTGYDIVQLINEDALNLTPKDSINFLNFIINKNKKMFLLVCGEDYTTISFFLKGNNGHSALTPLIENPKLKSRYSFSLKYISKPYKKLHNYIYQHINGVICSDIDYSRIFKNKNSFLGLIPNPINVDTLEYTPLKTDEKINIFHGINSLSSIKKGSKFFTEALSIIKKKYGDKVNIIETTNLPYKEYINIYNNAHILLDQVYAYDQGFNALEAMAKGKVVFTGAEQEWLDHYNLEEDTVAINALPYVTYLVEKLEWLINNPDQIQNISKNARQFIEAHHHYEKIAKKYLLTWQSN